MEKSFFFLIIFYINSIEKDERLCGCNIKFMKNVIADTLIVFWGNYFLLERVIST